MKRGIAGQASGTFVLLVALTTVAAADTTACDRLAEQYAAHRTTLEAPQVSAALFAAAESNCADLATRLLEDGASVAARDRLGGTALTHAARAGHAAVIGVLLTHGAELNLRTVEGTTPLFVAVEQNRTAAVQALVKAGADVNIPGKGGVSPLAAAAFNGNLALVELLLGHGADPALPDLGGKVPIVYAAGRGFTPVVARLLAAGTDVNARYGNQLTVLMWAAGHANDVPVDDGVGLVTMLLDKGAAVEARDDRGRTALMAAAELGHAEIVALLLKHGADPRDRDHAGKSAADLASAEPVRAMLASATGP